MLLNRPKFTALAVLVMATGLGLSVYMIAFLSNTLYKDLDFVNGEEIYTIETRVNDDPRTATLGFALLDYLAIKESNQSFSDIGGFHITRATVSDNEGSLRKLGAYVTTNLFDFLNFHLK